MIAFWIQFWLHIEHLLLIAQATFHHNLMGKPVPFSVLRSSSHASNFISSITRSCIPIVIAVYDHMLPPEGERESALCTCAWHKDDELQAPFGTNRSAV